MIGVTASDRGHRLPIDTLSKTTPLTGRGGQFFQLISLLLGNTYQLKELAAMSC